MVRMVPCDSSSGALVVELQHMVFCTEFWMGGGLESRYVEVVCTVRMVPCDSSSGALDVELQYMV